jgi:3-deoxy-D-manno-octulosonic-acid transferase
MMHLYRCLGILALPLALVHVLWRCWRGKELWGRLRERFAITTQSRPQAAYPGARQERLVWVHCASVGETRSAAPLVYTLKEHFPHVHILFTTCTVNAALDIRNIEMLTKAGVIHQFLPLDIVGITHRFLRTWRPDCVLWFESELWPNLLTLLKTKRIPTFLINARMSDRSFAAWQRFPGFGRQLLQAFTVILAQSDESYQRYLALGGEHVLALGNLKYSTPPLALNEAEKTLFEHALKDRPRWIAASTHPGEDDLVFEAHQKIRRQLPALLTFVAPRHPQRTPMIVERARQRGLKTGQRSQGDLPSPDLDIYIVDTMGELGLFYALSPVVCVCGSLMPIGGHNIIEPAHFATAILFGPHMENFRDVVRDFQSQHACHQVSSGDELSDYVLKLLAHPEQSLTQGQRARKVAQAAQGTLDRVMSALQPHLVQSLKP